MSRASDLDVVRQMFRVWELVANASVAGDADTIVRVSGEVGIEVSTDLSIEDPGARDLWWRALAARFWDADIVYREDEKWPGAGEYRGREAAVARFLDYFESFGPTRVELVGIREGERGLLAEWDLRTVGVGSGVPMEQRWAYVIRTRDGRVAEIHAHLDLEAARADAGVSGSP